VGEGGILEYEKSNDKEKIGEQGAESILWQRGPPLFIEIREKHL